jgi:hypothetical protein
MVLIMTPAMATEWSKAQAQAHRGLEAIRLVCEEAIRSVSFTVVERDRWTSLASTASGFSEGNKMKWGGELAENHCSTEDMGLRAGRRAYAAYRANVEAKFLHKMSKAWRPCLEAAMKTELVPALKTLPVRSYIPMLIIH